jgi:hypothetical protein
MNGEDVEVSGLYLISVPVSTFAFGYSEIARKLLVGRGGFRSEI